MFESGAGTLVEPPGTCSGTPRTQLPEPSEAVSARRGHMVRVPGGTFLMGSDRFYREERPVRRVEVEAFWIDAHPITNRQFQEFAEHTGYVTLAERAPDPRLYPQADPALLVPGSLVFRSPARRVSLRDPRAWWAYLPG